MASSQQTTDVSVVSIAKSTSLVVDGLGKDFPHDVPQIQWPNGIFTVLPFRPNHTTNSMGAVQKLAKTGVDEQNLAYSINLNGSDPSAKELKRFSDIIRSVLAVNEPVVLDNVPDAKCTWDFSLRSVKRLYGSLRSPIQWLDEDLRYQDIAEDKKYKTTTISEFVEDATNFQVAGVTTRQPRRGLADEHPLVHMLRDDDKAWASTHKRNNLVKLPRVTAIECDVMERSWIYMSHGGVYSPPSHFSSGMATWMQVIAGTQIIGFICRKTGVDEVPHEEIRNVNITRKEHFSFYSAVDGKVPLPDIDTLKHTHMFIDASKIIILPPGYRFDLYTPCKSIIIGGNFLCYDTLHLTEFARDYEAKFLRPSIQHPPHPSISRTLCRMAMSLGKCTPYIRMDSCGALFIMIGDASHYSFDHSSSISEDVEFYLRFAEVRIALKKMKELVERQDGSLNIDPGLVEDVCGQMRLKLEKLQRIVMGHAVSKQDVFMIKLI